MFESYSDRARRVVFLSRKIAGRRGAAEIGVEDLMKSLVVEDQGEFVKVFSGEMAAGVAVQWMSTHPAFFTAEIAAAIHRGLEPMMAPNGMPLADSIDMPLNAASKAVLEAAQELRDELHQDSHTAMDVGPLHLLAAMLADEMSEVTKIVNRAGVSREAVMAAIRSSEN